MKFRIVYILVILISASVNGQNLKDYLIIAEQNNPELQTARYTYEKSQAYVDEVGSLSNTTFSAGFFIQEAETRVGAQKGKFSVSQPLPWFGTLKAREETASLKSEAVLSTIELTKREVFLRVKNSYFELCESKKKTGLLEAHIVVLDTYEELALNALENNLASMVDVLKIRMERNILKNQLFAVSAYFESQQIAFNRLLNREDHLTIELALDFELNSSETLYEKQNMQEHPKLQQLEHLGNSLAKSVEVVQKEAKPTFGVGLDYVFVEERPVPNLYENGKDIVMPMLRLSVPVFSKKYKSKQQQLMLEQKAVESIKTTVNNQLYTRYDATLANLKSAKNSISTHKVNIVEASRAKSVLLAAYESGKVDYEQLLQIQQLELQFQLKKIASEKNYSNQIAQLEYLLTDF